MGLEVGTHDGGGSGRVIRLETHRRQENEMLIDVLAEDFSVVLSAAGGWWRGWGINGYGGGAGTM
jgi:hypothetical protein